MKKDPEKRYPEFGNLTRREILERLQLLEELLKIQQIEKDLEEKEEISLEKERLEEQRSLEEKEFWVIAHRGWSGSYPENTLIGMREAIKAGCHMIEFDAALTRDRKVIIIHDPDISRTTNGAGMVWEWDYKDLRKLDAGSWFHPAYAGLRVRLPSLEEILLLSKFSGIWVNIEIKYYYWEDELKEDSIENQIIRAVKKYQVEDRTLISSFKWSFIERIKSIDPSIQVALLHHKDVGKLDMKELKKRYDIFSFHPSILEITQKIVDKCHEEGIRVFPYTVNTYQEMQRCYNMGVDGFFTNHPNRVFSFLKEQKVRLKYYQEREKKEDFMDLKRALEKIAKEEMEKAERRIQWRAKRLLLEKEKKRESLSPP